jgi:hypothetical protein
VPDRPEGFDHEVRELVAETAPRLFAVVEEFNTDSGAPDARVAAWGMAYQDGTAQVTTTEGRTHLSLRSPERATRWISRRPGCSASLVWVG